MTALFLFLDVYYHLKVLFSSPRGSNTFVMEKIKQTKTCCSKKTLQKVLKDNVNFVQGRIIQLDIFILVFLYCELRVVILLIFQRLYCKLLHISLFVSLNFWGQCNLKLAANETDNWVIVFHFAEVLFLFFFDPFIPNIVLYMWNWEAIFFFIFDICQNLFFEKIVCLDESWYEWRKERKTFTTAEHQLAQFADRIILRLLS